MNPNSLNIDDLLRFMVKQQASDLHLKPMRPPLMRMNGKLLPLKAEPLKPDVIPKLLEAIIPERLNEALETQLAIDFGYSLPGVSRFRASVFQQRGTRSAVFRRVPFDFPGLKITGSTEESKAIKDIKGTVMVIAGSGMCTGGRVKHHLVNNITGPENTIMFVGYQAVGTLGRRIVNGEQEVRILGQNYPVKARIARINGFSAHADKEELYTWLSELKRPPKKLFVVHGEAESAQHFADYIGQKTGWQVVVPAYQDEVVLD